MPHTNLAFIHHMNHSTLIRSHNLFNISTAFMFGYKVSIKIVLIDRFTLPCYHVAIVQVVLIGTPFKVLCSVIRLHFVYMINDKPRLITIHKMKSHKTVNLIMFVIPMSVAK